MDLTMTSPQEKEITGGIYLVLNPAMEFPLLLKKLKSALEGGVHVIQIWNNWPSGLDESEKQQIVETLAWICKPYDVPVLINENWRLLAEVETLDGVHFDHIPDDLVSIKHAVGRPFITGITCGNDAERLNWGQDHGVDYFSFCAMFPSKSAGECEIVRPDTVSKAREITSKPLFVSGGITPKNLPQLETPGIDGIAVISGIMESEDPAKAVQNYQEALSSLKE